jgi:hypothetical protein
MALPSHASAQALFASAHIAPSYVYRQTSIAHSRQNVYIYWSGYVFAMNPFVPHLTIFGATYYLGLSRVVMMYVSFYTVRVRVLNEVLRRSATVLLFLLTTSVACFAQEPQGFLWCGCISPSTPVSTVPAQICIDGVSFDVNISFCSLIFSPPKIAQCSSIDAVNEATTFLEVCGRSGAVLPSDNQKVIDAVFCAMDPFGGDILNMRSKIPKCNEYPNYYCWQITMPRCVQRNGNCVQPCAWFNDHHCCKKLWRMCTDPSTGNPIVLDRTTALCPIPTQECEGSCQNVLCGQTPGACEPCP